MNALSEARAMAVVVAALGAGALATFAMFVGEP